MIDIVLVLHTLNKPSHPTSHRLTLMAPDKSLIGVGLFMTLSVFCMYKSLTPSPEVVKWQKENLHARRRSILHEHESSQTIAAVDDAFREILVQATKKKEQD